MYEVTSRHMARSDCLVTWATTSEHGQLRASMGNYERAWATTSEHGQLRASSQLPVPTFSI
jgi:hypothetical protein